MRRQDSHVKVLDGLLSIHHFARKCEPRVAVRVVNVHGCVHVGPMAVCGAMIVCGAVEKEVEAAAAADNELPVNQGESGEGEGEGSKRDGGSPIGGTDNSEGLHLPEVAVGAPQCLRFCASEESGREETRSANRDTTAINGHCQIRAPMRPKRCDRRTVPAYVAQGRSSLAQV